jgi:hypothetical protein
MSASLSSTNMSASYERLQTPSVWRTNYKKTSGPEDSMSASGMDDIEIPAFLRKQSDANSPTRPPQEKVKTQEVKANKVPPQEASRADIAMALNTAALQASSFRIALQHTLKLNMPGSYATYIVEMTRLTKDSATSWALLLEYLFGDIEQSGLLDRHAKRLLRSQLKLATDDMREKALELIEKTLVA